MIQIGNVKFKDNPERQAEVEKILQLCTNHLIRLRQPFNASWIKHLLMMIYINACIDLRNDRDDQYAFDLRKASGDSIFNKQLLELIDKIIFK